jgi:uncharacterized protein
MRPWLLALLVTVVPASSLAMRFPAPPPDGLFVVDDAGLLTAGQRNELSATASALFAQEQLALYVVTLSSLAGYDAAAETIETYATALFDAWGIGTPDRNAGMLLVVSVADRKARIELGGAWGRSHDAEASEVMRTLIVPAFKRGDFPGGLQDGVRGMEAMARGLALPRARPPAWLWPVVLAVAVGLAALVVSLFRSGKRGWGWAVLAGVGAVFLYAALRRGGGGGPRGGGSSGGGGATGSW